MMVSLVVFGICNHGILAPWAAQCAELKLLQFMQLFSQEYSPLYMDFQHRLPSPMEEVYRSLSTSHSTRTPTSHQISGPRPGPVLLLPVQLRRTLPLPPVPPPCPFSVNLILTSDPPLREIKLT